MPTEKGPALSVVVPTNSRVALFLETLASLERQSLDSFELIVTDDSRLPTDRMAIREATMKYADRTGRATRYLFSDPGLGQARNTNQGLTAASGHLIRILHSDDLLARRALEAEIALMSDPRLCIEFLFHYCVPFVNSPRFDNQPVLSLVQPAHFFRNRMHSGTPLPSGVVFTASALREVGPMQSNLDFLCDWEFVARLILREHKYNRFLGSLSQGFVGWREHQESTTGRFWHKHFLEHEQFIEDICRNSELCVELFPDEQARAIFRTIAVRYRYCRLSRDVSRLQMSRLIREMPQILHCVLSVRSLLELLRPAPWTAIGSLLYPKIKSSSPGSLPRKQKQPGRKLADPRGGLRFALSAHFARKVISWGNAWAERQMNRDPGLKGGNQAFSGTAGAITMIS